MKHEKSDLRSTESILSLGMALKADRSTMEQRIRGIFSRKSSKAASAFAFLIAVFLIVGCFTTACRPVSAAKETPAAGGEPAAPAPEGEVQDGTAPLLAFAGPASAKLDGDTVTVTSADGKETVFTVVDDGMAEYSEAFEGTGYVTPQQAAAEAARVAVMLWGDTAEGCEIHVEKQKYPDYSLEYYQFGFGDKAERGSAAFGLVDAKTGTLLTIDANEWGRNSAEYGHDFLNEKIRTWEWDSEKYADARTSEKAMATAVELVEKCFPTGTVIPCVTKDGPDWDAVSYTDGEQIAWSGGYMALVDVYLRMDRDPCYYARIGVPLEEGAEPSVEIFSTYPLGWEYCKEGMWDPVSLEMELAERADWTYTGSDRTRRVYKPFSEDEMNGAADYAVRAAEAGDRFILSEADLYTEEFIEEQGRDRCVSMGFVDRSLGIADPWSVEWLFLKTPAQVERYALRGQVLEFNQSGLWAVYTGDGQCVYAASDGTITRASVSDMMQGGACHLQINAYLTLSPEVEALLDPAGEQRMPTPTPAPTAVPGN